MERKKTILIFTSCRKGCIDGQADDVSEDNKELKVDIENGGTVNCETHE